MDLWFSVGDFHNVGRNHCVDSKWSEGRLVVSDCLWPYGLYSPWNSPGQHTGVGSLSLLQGIFPTQGLNPGLPHCRQILYQLRHQGSPRILGWVAYPFSRGSSWPRDQTGVSCTKGRFFTNWAMRIVNNCQMNLWKVLCNLLSIKVQDLLSLWLGIPIYSVALTFGTYLLLSLLCWKWKW